MDEPKRGSATRSADTGCAPRGRLCWFGLIAAIAAAGCAANADRDPIGLMLDRGQDRTRRRTALEQAGSVAKSPDPVRYLGTLHELAWSDRHPDELRTAAIDRLIAYDADAFRRDLDRRIVRLNRWAVMRHIFDRAVRDRWDGFTPTAILSYARPSAVYRDEDRPERRVIAALNGGRHTEDVVWEVFRASGTGGARMAGIPRTPGVLEVPGVGLRHQVAAWTLLNRLADPAQLRLKLLAESWPDAGGLLTADLSAAARVLDVLPIRRESVAWLIYLRHGASEYWDAVSTQAGALREPQRRGLALRHLAVVADPHSAPDSRERLLERIRGRLASAHHVLRDERLQRDPGWTEDLEVQTRRLAWADLATIGLIQDGLDDILLAAQLFTQADVDRLDETSEHGGVLVRRGDRLAAKACEPDIRAHDRRFYASPELLRRMYTGIAHYHFHAQSHRNFEFAGPGPGDQQFVDRHGAAALVFTFVDADTLNVDYYQPGGVVVDLGCLRR